MLRANRLKSLLPAAAAALLLAGCGTSNKPPLPAELGGQSPSATQCLDLFRHVIPDAEIEVTGAKVVNDTPTRTTVSIDGTRGEVAPSPIVARDIAVECKFDHDVLVDFHWTKPPFR
jgi:nitrous oxide reductase accessory protein NosL